MMSIVGLFCQKSACTSEPSMFKIVTKIGGKRTSAHFTLSLQLNRQMGTMLIWIWSTTHGAKTELDPSILAVLELRWDFGIWAFKSIQLYLNFPGCFLRHGRECQCSGQSRSIFMGNWSAAKIGKFPPKYLMSVWCNSSNDGGHGSKTGGLLTPRIWWPAQDSISIYLQH